MGCLQGIASDVKRTQANEGFEDIGRIQHDDPDLTAYWTFEEGSGYLVKDVTGKGHDLHIQQPPQWRVSFLAITSWLSAGSRLPHLWRCKITKSPFVLDFVLAAPPSFAKCKLVQW